MTKTSVSSEDPPAMLSGGSLPRLTTGGILIVCWGILGVVLLLGKALWRLTPLAIEPVAQGMMHAGHWTAYVLWSAMNAYMEGYRGFQKSFSPMVAQRALELAEHPRPLYIALAPLYCMALFAAPRKRMIVSWFILVAVVGLVLLIRQLDQPWRGIVDVGVVIGLAWGALSVLYFGMLALLGRLLPPLRD